MHKATIFAVMFFIIGSALHTLAQIDAIARAKNNPMNSRMALLTARFQTILNRGAWSVAFFTLWLQGQLVALLTAAHLSLPAFATGILDLHIGGAVAFMAGYLSDSALAFIPGLNTSIPAPIDSPNGASAPAATGNSTAAKIDSPPPKA